MGRVSRAHEPAALLSSPALSSKTNPGGCVVATFPQHQFRGGTKEVCRRHHHISNALRKAPHSQGIVLLITVDKHNKLKVLKIMAPKCE